MNPRTRIYVTFLANLLLLLLLPSPVWAGWAGWATRRLIPPVPGLVIQFEGDTGRVTTVGSAVSSWIDNKSGFSVTQGTSGKRPVFTAADSSFGGRPSLSGTVAAATQLTNTTDTPFAAGASRTMFFTFKAAVTAYGAMHDSRHTVTARPSWLWGDLSGSAFIYTDNVAVNQTIPTPGSLTTPHRLAEIWQSGSPVQVWLDGASQVVTGGSPTLDVAASGFDVFSLQNGGTNFEGKIAAILCFSGALSAGNRQLIDLYLQQKYGF